MKPPVSVERLVTVNELVRVAVPAIVVFPATVRVDDVAK
jgi:hypothetical protein